MLVCIHTIVTIIIICIHNIHSTIMMMCNTMQHSTVAQCNIRHYSSIRYNTIQCNAVSEDWGLRRSSRPWGFELSHAYIPETKRWIDHGLKHLLCIWIWDLGPSARSPGALGSEVGGAEGTVGSHDFDSHSFKSKVSNRQVEMVTTFIVPTARPWWHYGPWIRVTLVS